MVLLTEVRRAWGVIETSHPADGHMCKLKCNEIIQQKGNNAGRGGGSMMLTDTKHQSFMDLVSS